MIVKDGESWKKDFEGNRVSKRTVLMDDDCSDLGMDIPTNRQGVFTALEEICC
jgi:hypothetical protein